MRFIILFTIVLFSLTGFSQEESIQTIFKKAAPKETVKIIMDVSDYDANTIVRFKEKLSTLKSKIEIVHYDDISSLFTIVYNNNMTLRDFTGVFDEYKISYLVKDPVVKSNNPTY